MKLEHRIGQLLLIGLPGPQLDLMTRSLLQTIQPGGILLNKHNIESAQQVAELTSTIRSLTEVPPIIAVDQEGGRVDRLKEIYSPMPSADLLRAAGDASIAARMGEINAEALRTLGFNTNFAPVLDIAVDDAANNGLKGRYLGSSVAEVVRLGGAYLEGLKRGGVVGVAKHFPGLGAATLDSHDALPTVDSSRDQILKHEVAPYSELFTKINARLDAVIVAHAHYPAFDGPAPLPSSLSKNVATGLLREELGFKGLSITDDLEMGAITTDRELSEAAVMAIEAGVDMVMIADSSSPERATGAWEAMVKAAQDGRITKSHIGRAFDHIARIKATISPPHAYSEQAVSRLRERIAELNLILQHSK
ncbi:MAG TPA: glycoside hydrolase family 3 N-terminal domain-containing protein [Blastocatellia bacterium]|nr:glycoside hydrolase family 3 N-terminal domain-containing protein [Blastocatellia bacterium]